MFLYDPNVEYEVRFFYENLVGISRQCYMIFHQYGVCLVAPKQVAPQAAKIVAQALGLNQNVIYKTFTFKENMPTTPPIKRVLFFNI